MPKIIGSTLAEHRERTRNALFDALSDLMTQQSFEKITLSDVATHAGVGRTAVYNHFADKEDLLLAFMEHEVAQYAGELNAALTGIDDPIDRLRIYVRTQALIKRHYHFPTAGPLSHSVSHTTAGNLRAHAARTTAILTDILNAAIDSGAIPPQDPTHIIPLLHATIMGGRPTPADPQARAAYLDALDTFILRAVGAPQPDHAVPEVPLSSSENPHDADATPSDSGTTHHSPHSQQAGAISDDAPIRCPVLHAVAS